MLKLKQLRLENGLTQRELGARAGVTQAFISQLELGKRKGPVKTWERLGSAFNVRADILREEARSPK